jgi:hypothetical protein
MANAEQPTDGNLKVVETLVMLRVVSTEELPPDTDLASLAQRAEAREIDVLVVSLYGEVITGEQAASYLRAWNYKLEEWGRT